MEQELSLQLNWQGNYLLPEQSDTGDIIFDFIPYGGVAYSLTAVMDVFSNNLGNVNISFDPITLTCTNSGCQLS